MYEDDIAQIDNGFRYAFQTEIVEAVQRFLQTEAGRKLKMVGVKLRVSRTANEEYKSFGCFWCDALFGDFFVRHEILIDWHGLTEEEEIKQSAAVLLTEVDIIEPVILQHPTSRHYCDGKFGRFCC